MLSQINTIPGDSLKTALLILGWTIAALASAATIYNAVKKRRIEPQPLEVHLTADFVKKEECISRHAESLSSIDAVRRDVSELRVQRIADSKDAGASREKMYQAIKDVRLELSGQTAELRKEVSQGFADIERALGRLEGKINGSV